MPLIPDLTATPTPVAGNPVIASAEGSPYEAQLFDFCRVRNPKDADQVLIFCSMMAAPLGQGVEVVGLFTHPWDDPETWTYIGIVLETPSWNGAEVRCDSAAVLDADAGTIVMSYSDASSLNGVGVAYITVTGTVDAIGDLDIDQEPNNPILTPNHGGVFSNETAVHQCAFLKNWNGSLYIDGDGYAYALYSYRTAGAIMPGLRLARTLVASADFELTPIDTGGDVLQVPSPTSGNLFCEFHQWIILPNGKFCVIQEAGDFNDTFQLWALTADALEGPYDLVGDPLLAPSGTVSAFDRYHVATGEIFESDGRVTLAACGAAGPNDPNYTENLWQAGVWDLEFTAQAPATLGFGRNL